MKPQRTSLGVLSLESLRRWLEQYGRVLAGQVSFGATINNADNQSRNIECSTAHGTTPGTVNTDFTIQHTLGRVPVTIAGQDTNNGGLLYRGSAAWTATTATLRCTTATAAYNVILV